MSRLALERLLSSGLNLTVFLSRHREGDYGAEMLFEERRANEERITRRSWVRSYYSLDGGVYLEVVTAQGWDKTHVFLQGEEVRAPTS